MSTVVDGRAMASVDKVYYNGSYSLNGNWTVWNGNRNHNQVKLNELSLAQNAVDSTTTVTIRERDSKSQVRVNIAEVASIVKQIVEGQSTWGDISGGLRGVAKVARASPLAIFLLSNSLFLWKL